MLRVRICIGCILCILSYLKITLEKVCYGPPSKFRNIPSLFGTYLSHAAPPLPGAWCVLLLLFYIVLHSVDIPELAAVAHDFALLIAAQKHIVAYHHHRLGQNQQNCSSVISMYSLVHGTYLLKISKCFLRNEMYFLPLLIPFLAVFLLGDLGVLALARNALLDLEVER